VTISLLKLPFMRTFKVLLITAAIVISIGGAFASKKQNGCVYATNYRLAGGSYQEVGVLGVDYFCWDLPGTCTYYKPNAGVEYYLPCRSGVYEAIPHSLKKKK
jgi:hypothetical protein